MVKDQIVGILNLPELYKELPNIISVNKLESTELVVKAKTLTKLLNQYGQASWPLRGSASH